MRYSLFSRFQGALCGSLIAEALSHNPSRLMLIEEVLSPWTKISLDLIERLIDRKKLSEIDWQTEKQPLSSSMIALATLPLAVYWHDYGSQWREELDKLTTMGADFEQGIVQGTGYRNKDVLIWGYAISLALREKLNPSQFIAQLMEQCPTGETAIGQQLGQIQTFLDQGTPLIKVVSQLSRPVSASQPQKEEQSSPTAMALAFYCFAATPEDFRLSVLRARQTGYQTSVTMALTGALAGAYNGFNGISLPWRWGIRSQPIGQCLYQQVSRLFALWAGVYLAEESEILSVSAVASPLVIQPRFSLKIISQKEYR